MTGPLWLQLQCSCDIWHLAHETRKCRKLCIMNKVLSVLLFLTLFLTFLYYLHLYIIFLQKKCGVCSSLKVCHPLMLLPNSHLSLKDAYSMFVVKLHLFKFKCSVLCTLTFSQELIALPAACCTAHQHRLQSHFYMSPSIDLYAQKTHKSMINVMRSGCDGPL